MALTKLTLSSLRTRKARLALTVLAVAFSVSLVVAITSGYASARAALMKYLFEFMGATDVELTYQGQGNGVSQSLLEEIRRDPDVQSAVARLETAVKLADPSGQRRPELDWKMPTAVGVELPADYEVFNLPMEPGTNGAWFQGDAGEVAVIDQELAKLMKVGVGDSIILPSPDKQLRLKVVAVVHKPALMATLQQTLYLPLPTLQQFLNSPGKVGRILVNIKPGGDHDAFAQRWQQRLAQTEPDLKIRTARQSRKELDQHLQGFEMLSHLGGVISMLAATFIVFSTLSMGVTERQRTLAMLRAIGAERWQIGALVVLEGVVLATLGVLIGVPLGLLFDRILVAWKPDIFLAGLVPSVPGILLGGLGSILTALLASLLPAFNAMRVHPLDALTAQGQPHNPRLPFWAALAGLPLVLLDPALMFLPGIPRPLAFYGHFALGIPALMFGFFLFAPLFVWLVEKSFGRAVARLLGIRHALLAQQLTGAIWRAAGTAAALMVGLAILIVMQTQGNSALAGWRLPDKFPDIFIFAPLGLNKQQAETLRTVEGIKPDQVLPLAIAVAGLPPGYLSFAGMALIPDTTMFIGTEMDKALQMIELDFRHGNRQQALAMLKQGRHILVTEEFRQLKSLDVGDKLSLKTPKSGLVEYTIAGVVWSPGIDVFVTKFDMGRQFEERSAGTVFGSMEDIERDFGVSKVHLFGANLNYFVERQDLEERLRQKLGAWGLAAGDVRQIKHRIQEGFQRLLMLLSTVAFAAIAVAALGVTNTIMASIRTRRWQLGVLRSVGMTRGQMVRLILAEGMLLGLVGCALGLTAGLVMSVNANGLSRKIIGYAVPIRPPWDIVGLGLLIILAVALLASLYPAASAAREEPLELLQAGRAGT